MFTSLRRSHYLTFTLVGIAALFNAPTACRAADLSEIAQAASNPTQAAPLPNRDQFQSVPVKPPSSFWQFPQSTAVTGPSQLVQQFYAQTLTPQQLGEGDFGCFRSQSAIVERLTPQSVAVILTQMGSCDDSLSGQQTRVDFTAQGDRWQVDWVGQRNHCRGKFWAEPGQLCP